MQESQKEKNNLVPNPQNLEEALKALKDFLYAHSTLYDLMHALNKLLPEKPEEERTYSYEELKTIFLCGKAEDDYYRTIFSMSPTAIALVTLDEFFKNSERFKIIDPRSLPECSRLETPYQPPRLTHTTFDMAGTMVSTPLANELWIEDLKTNVKLIIEYKPQQNGGVNVAVMGNYNQTDQISEFVKEIKLEVLKSPLIRGQIIEVTAGGGFSVVDLPEQPYPVIEEGLKNELEKNIVNLFDKGNKFAEFGLPIKRSVILAGPPGCGKTLLERWLAASLRGRVTTIWVSAKSIKSPDDVAEIFELSRKLTPCFIVLEDLDLITGNRSGHSLLEKNFANCLGEMLNQLDGLKQNESLVMLASTNKIEAIDEALAERPGRFDRVYEVGKPTPALAEKIAIQYLQKRGISDEIINSLSLATVFKGDSSGEGEFTGAQVVEIVKGAIFEAIHRGGEINDFCLITSRDGLKGQRKLRKK